MEAIAPTATAAASAAGASRDAPTTAKPPAPPPPTLAWTSFGPSALQRAADEKWRPEPDRVLLQRFVDEQLPRLKTYRDYREMLEKQKDLDAIIIATPDHMHAPIASAAMAAGKHVYVQKPMCWSVAEARHLAAQAAANPKLVTQMGNQGHSLDDARRGQDYLASGMLGDITEVHVWTNRPLAYWPQGVPRPKKFDGNWKDLELEQSRRHRTARARLYQQSKVQPAERASVGPVPRRGA